MKPLISTSKVYSPQEMEVYQIMNVPFFFFNFKLCPLGGGWKGGYITQEPLQGSKAGGGVRYLPRPAS